MYKVYNKKTHKLVQIITAAQYEAWTRDYGKNDVPISDYTVVFVPEGRIQVAFARGQEMKWVIQTTERSRCSSCERYLDLLSPDLISLAKPLTMFWICWSCQRVIQVGVGQVEREATDI